MSRSRSAIKTKPSDSLAQFVRYTTSPHLWAANPNDPYIYISFSKQQAELGLPYGGSESCFAMVSAKSIQNLKKTDIKKYKDLIKKEWIEKAKVPVEFLSSTSTQEEIREKNIVFVLSNSDEQGGGSVTNCHINTEDVNFKLAFPPISIFHEHYMIYQFLHETMHAIIEGKHFADVDNIRSKELPPFNVKMTCLDSVMAYPQHCPPVHKELTRLFGDERVYLNDPRPEVQKKLGIAMGSCPTVLGPADVDAAADFVKSWKIRNKKALKNQKVTQEVKIDAFPDMSFGAGGAVSFGNVFSINSNPHLSIEAKISADHMVGATDFVTQTNSISPIGVSFSDVVSTLVTTQILSKFSLFNRLPWNREKNLSAEDKVRFQSKIELLDALELKFEDLRKYIGNQDALIDIKKLFIITRNHIEKALKKNTITGAECGEIDMRIRQCQNKIEKVEKCVSGDSVIKLKKSSP